MGKDVDPALNAKVIIQHVLVKFAQLRSVASQHGAIERCGNVSLYQSGTTNGNKALNVLYK